MEHLGNYGQTRLQNGEGFSPRTLIERGEKVVVFSRNHRICTLVPVNGALYFRDLKGDVHPVLESKHPVPHSGGLKICYFEHSGSLTFWFEELSDVTYSKDRMTPFEEKTYAHRVEENGKGPNELPVTRNRTFYALLLTAAIGVGTALALKSDGCSSAAGEKASEKAD